MNHDSRPNIYIEKGELKINPVLVLKGIIEDNYPPQTFIKEILQNADDAGADSLHLGWHPGWPNASNTLLQYPMILAINNGRFSPKDRSSINTLYAGAKVEDSEKIGKYGLGLKMFRLPVCSHVGL